MESVKSDADLVHSRADQVESDADLVRSRADRVESDVDLVRSRADLVESVANFDHYLAICWGFAIKRSLQPALNTVLNAHSRKETQIHKRDKIGVFN